MSKQEETVKRLAEENEALRAKLRYAESKLSAMEFAHTVLLYAYHVATEQCDDYAGSCEALEEENKELNEQLDKAFARRDYWREQALS